MTFNEDKVKTKSKKLGAILSSIRTVAIQIVKKYNKKNLRATCEKFVDKLVYLVKFLKKIKFV